MALVWLLEGGEGGKTTEGSKVQIEAGKPRKG